MSLSDWDTECLIWLETVEHCCTFDKYLRNAPAACVRVHLNDVNEDFKQRKEWLSVSSVITVKIISQCWVWFNPIRGEEQLNLNINRNLVEADEEGEERDVCLCVRQRRGRGWQRSALHRFKELSGCLKQRELRLPVALILEAVQNEPYYTVRRNMGSPLSHLTCGRI